MHPNGTRAVAKSLIYIFMWSSAGAAQQPPAPAPAAASSAPTEDIGWPRQVIKNGSTLVYYQPQVDEWKDYRELKAQVAFSLTPAGGKQTLGVASMHASTLVDKDTRTAFFRNLEVTSVRFPAMDPASAPS